jgi:hypothetical protein
MKTLSDLCNPRSSVFDRTRLDTVYNLDDLPSIKPDEFFSENYVTEGMRILLIEAFNRLEENDQRLWNFLAKSIYGWRKDP